MALKYQTGTATLTQLIVMLLLNLLNAIVSIVQGCVQHNQCVSNAVVSALYVIVLAVWLIFLSALGFAAQDRRSRRIAQLLIASEAVVAVVALFDMRHFPNILGLITSTIDFCLAIWIITLAWRLSQSRGGRIVATSSRPRERKHRTPISKS